jgi:chromosome segregation ATPase
MDENLALAVLNEKLEAENAELRSVNSELEQTVNELNIDVLNVETLKENYRALNLKLLSEITEVELKLKEYEVAHVKLLNEINELENEHSIEVKNIKVEQWKLRDNLNSKLLHYEDRDAIINKITDLIDARITAQKFGWEWIVTEQGMSLTPAGDFWSDELMDKIDEAFEPYAHGWRNYN